jgi:hypothetical protein
MNKIAKPLLPMAIVAATFALSAEAATVLTG